MKTLLILQGHHAREALYLAAERDLEERFALVRIVDSISEEFSRLTVPTADAAEVVAREPPKLLPGGITLLVSYVVLPFDSLFATEYRLSGTSVEGSRTVLLAPERQGRRK